MHVFLVTAQPGAHPRRVARLLLDAGHRVAQLGIRPQTRVSGATTTAPSQPRCPALPAAPSGSGPRRTVDRAARLRALCVRHRPDVINGSGRPQRLALRPAACAPGAELLEPDINDLFTPGRVTPQRRAQVAQALAAADHRVPPTILSAAGSWPAGAGHQLAFRGRIPCSGPSYAAEAGAPRAVAHSRRRRVLLSVRRQAPFLGKRTAWLPSPNSRATRQCQKPS